MMNKCAYFSQTGSEDVLQEVLPGKEINKNWSKFGSPGDALEQITISVPFPERPFKTDWGSSSSKSSPRSAYKIMAANEKHFQLLATKYKELSCRREAARCFASSNTLLSR